MASDRRMPPPRLRPWNPAVSPAAEAIVMRCLEPDPAHRYQEAHHLLDDLQRQLEDRPLRHTPEPSVRERLAKWSRRHPRLSSGTVLGSVAALVVAALVAGYVHRERQLGGVRAAVAFRQLAEAHESARVLLFEPTADPERRREGLAFCREALRGYGLPANVEWLRSPLVTNLPEPSRDALRAKVGEILVLGARALARQAAAAEPAARAGLSLEALQWNDRATDCYRPDQVPHLVWNQRASLAALAGEADEAERSRRLADATAVGSPDEHALLFVDDPSHAARIFAALAEASRRNPQDFTLWMILGQCQAAAGRLAEADDSFTVAAALRPRSPWPYFDRGRVELERNDFDQALADFDLALRLRPGLAVAHGNRAIARLGRDDAPGAVADLTAALELGAPETWIYFRRAEARARAGDIDGAERDRAEGLRRTPRDAESWVTRALARLPDNPEGALADLDAALRLDPHSRPALQNKAAVLSERLSRATEAIAVLDRAVALYPDYLPSRVGRGVVLARLGRRVDAHHDAEESRRRDASSETIYRVACIYALTSKSEPADRPRALYWLAAALAQDAAWCKVARTDHDLDALRGLAGFSDLLRTFSESPGPPG
jgi:tetratricopeptide (TPR) repeat protein